MPDTTTVTCKPITIWEGPADCFEQECDEYWTNDGETPTGIAHCSHLHERQICETHSTLTSEGGEWETYEPAAPWPCPHTAGSGAAQ